MTPSMESHTPVLKFLTRTLKEVPNLDWEFNSTEFEQKFLETVQMASTCSKALK